MHIYMHTSTYHVHMSELCVAHVVSRIYTYKYICIDIHVYMHTCIYTYIYHLHMSVSCVPYVVSRTQNRLIKYRHK